MATIVGFSSCGCGSGEMEGEYISQNQNGWIKSIDFKGGNSVLITGIALLNFPTSASYVRDGKIIRIKVRDDELMLTEIDNKTLKGEALPISGDFFIKNK